MGTKKVGALPSRRKRTIPIITQILLMVTNITGAKYIGLTEPRDLHILKL